MKTKKYDEVNNKIGFKSEEYCSNCETVFDTTRIKTFCPNCGRIVWACNACDNQNNCPKCLRGASQFKY